MEVELVAVEDRRSWFVFEVELDGSTKISRRMLNFKQPESASGTTIVG